MQAFLKNPDSPPVGPFLYAATDPVEGLTDSLPIRPDRGGKVAEELWEEQLRRRPRRKRPSAPPTQPPADDEHQIDDYA